MFHFPRSVHCASKTNCVCAVWEDSGAQNKDGNRYWEITIPNSYTGFTGAWWHCVRRNTIVRVLVLAHLDFVNSGLPKPVPVLCACMNTHLNLILTTRLGFIPVLLLGNAVVKMLLEVTKQTLQATAGVFVWAVWEEEALREAQGRKAPGADLPWWEWCIHHWCIRHCAEGSGAALLLLGSFIQTCCWFQNQNDLPENMERV